MSDRQIDMNEYAVDDALAKELGISRADLHELSYSVEEHETSDGSHIGYNVTFDTDASNPDALAKIKGLVNGSWIRIGLLGIER